MMSIPWTIIGVLSSVIALLVAIQKGLLSFSHGRGVQLHKVKSLERQLDKIEECYVEEEDLEDLQEDVKDIRKMTHKNSRILSKLEERTDIMLNGEGDT